MNSQKAENLLNLSRDATEREREKSAALSMGYDRETIPEIEYIEKPKSLYFQITNGRRASCIEELQEARFDLRGKGVILAVLDSGIDYTLSVFRNQDGTTRILNLWDQSLQTDEKEGVSPRAPCDYKVGVEFTRREIDEALSKSSFSERLTLVPSLDSIGHGTAVTGIAAGIASESDLLIVKLGNAREKSFPRTTELMMGLDYFARSEKNRDRHI